ncbi:hypothetical protein EDD37DRAFT_645653 [Exophiala viscosa]|uniref:DUF7626 domain-containing protein n=1 Tax=Exophiala viscosa TaxID=2486360 RepID=A0AAN6E3P1_9EURO|nr:hypothetical protein EDD36DRAFT_493005 [Exophiala viscosa]KAI1629922.1 hypothetical protein EDD37DRAFT_645653 [Exophiala viscosa]
MSTTKRSFAQASNSDPGAQIVMPLRQSRINPPNYTRKRGPPAVVWRQSKHPLPYFANQQLDPEYFPLDIGLPVGGPKMTDGNENAAWNDDDSDNGADIDSDAEGNNENPRPKVKSRAIANTAVAADFKSLKIPGGRPAVAKKISADLDSDDELIVRMKEARYLEKDIAQALVDKGRINYNPKTIGTRWRRLKRALQKRQDDLLDADLTDWHDGDDDVLLQAVAKADAEVQRLKNEIENQKWRMVANNMKNLKPVVNFSQNACRGRYGDLMNGIAKPTPESHPNPGPEILERIKSRQDKEERVAQTAQMSAVEQANIAGNGWSSRQRIYF